MSATNNSSAPVAPTFVVGQEVTVWAPKGLRFLSQGLASSERLGGDLRDLIPGEPLMVLKVYGQTGADVQRADGTIFRLHRNHVVADAKYNQAKAAKAKAAPALTAAQRLEAARALAEAAQRAYDEELAKEAELASAANN
jgi:hypothetical protein